MASGSATSLRLAWWRPLARARDHAPRAVALDFSLTASSLTGTSIRACALIATTHHSSRTPACAAGPGAHEIWYRLPRKDGVPQVGWRLR